MSILKRIVKLLVSTIVFAIDSVRAGQWCYLTAGTSHKPKCVILYYHGVSDAQRQAFVAQMDLVLQTATVIRCDEDDVALKEGLNIGITFDDGLMSTVRNALPEMSKRKMPCMLFVPTGQLGRRPRWEGTDRPEFRLDEVMEPQS